MNSTVNLEGRIDGEAYLELVGAEQASKCGSELNRLHDTPISKPLELLNYLFWG
jgi:hypothetical protein